MKQFTSKLKRLQVGADAFLHKAWLTCLSQDEKASIKLHTDIATELNDIARSAKFMNTLEIEQAWLGPCTMYHTSQLTFVYFTEFCVRQRHRQGL